MEANGLTLAYAASSNTTVTDTESAPVDAGLSPVDAGLSTVDAGFSQVDAGFSPVDADLSPVDAGLSPVAVATPVMRHNLPQIPSMTRNPNIAQSKASARESVSPEKVVPVHLVPNVSVHAESYLQFDALNDTGSEISLAAFDSPPRTNVESKSAQNSPQKSEANSSSSNTPIKMVFKKSGEAMTSTLTITKDGETLSIANKSAGKSDKLDKGKKKQKRKRSNTDVASNVIDSHAAGATMKTGHCNEAGQPVDEMVPKWQLADLVWSKVVGHPWWPCIVAYDPTLGLYTRIVGANSRRMYHVQYFGNQSERGWVNEKSVLPFEGREQFERQKDEALAHATTKSGKAGVRKSFDVPNRRRPAWEVAVNAAETAFGMTRDDRKVNYKFMYDPLVTKPREKDVAHPEPLKTKSTDNRKGGAKRDEPLRSDEERVLDEEPDAKRKRDVSPKNVREQISDSVSSDTTPVVSPSVRRKRLTPAELDAAHFEVFCAKKRDQIQKDHPDYDEETIQEYLLHQWRTMSQVSKSSYKPTRGRKVAAISAKLTAMRRTATRNKPPKKRYIEQRDKGSEGDSSTPVAKTPTKTKRKVPAFASMSLDGVVDSVAAGLGDIPQPTSFPDTPESFIDTPQITRKARMTKRSSSIASSSEAGPSKLSQENEIKLDADTDTESTTSEKKTSGYELEIFKLISAGPTRKETLCAACEMGQGQLVICDGPCLSSFHLKCVGLDAQPAEPFKCQECSSGIHTCFVCKESSAATRRCTVPSCGKFYHESCIATHYLTRTEAKGFTCPLHVCATCAEGEPKCPKASKGRLFRCVRCPTAYHVGDFCIAAGSMPLGGYHIVCSSHFQPVKTITHHQHIHVSWCFICNKGGRLLCCDSCPAAFHAECLKVDEPEGSWFCRDCSIGKKPLYGDIIWVKLGSFRWWPGEICHPANAPLNIQDKSHQVGEFPVRFFGSHDYFWTHQARVFLYYEGDKGSKECGNYKIKSLVRTFKKAIQEVGEAFHIWKKAKENKEQMEIERDSKKPSYFKFIKLEKATIVVCECQPTMTSPCGPDSECLNRLMMVECPPQSCPAGELCQNQRFQKRQYTDAQQFRTSERGWGLKTMVDIKKGEFVIEYVGELVDYEECKRRMDHAHENNISNFYMLTLDHKRVIDAGPKGNSSRFINHSCQPNLDTQKWNVNGNIRVGLFANTDTPSGMELTFNYNLDALGNEKTVCLCGAKNCSGFLGERPKNAKETNGDGVRKKKKKRKPKLDVRKTKEDDCFRCGDGGEVVMCDRRKCPKVYHLQCLGLETLPYGKWDCPWHHCDDCGKHASKHCCFCPNSFCSLHAVDGKLIEREGGILVCEDCKDDDARVLPGIQSQHSSDTTTSDTSSQSGSSVPDEAAASIVNGEPDTPSSISEALPAEVTKVKKLRRKATPKKQTAPKKIESVPTDLGGQVQNGSVGEKPTREDSDEENNLVIDIPGMS